MIQYVNQLFFSEGIKSVQAINKITEDHRVIECNQKELDFIEKIIDEARDEGLTPRQSITLNKFYRKKSLELAHQRVDFYTTSIQSLQPIYQFAKTYGFTNVMKDAQILITDYKQCLDVANKFIELQEQQNGRK